MRGLRSTTAARQGPDLRQRRVRDSLTGTCNPDFNIGQIGVITRWTPVKNLTFSADFTYSHLDQKYSGVITTPALASVAKPAATYELKDQDTYSLLLRAQRNW